MTRWGVVATAKAPAVDIMNFAAHHLQLGAARVHIYLDDDNTHAETTLRSQKSCLVTVCNQTYWKNLRGKRPPKHQVRQLFNATDAYARTDDLDWLIHLDVDEFLWPNDTVAAILGREADQTFCLRIRPWEALSGGQAFKAFVPDGKERRQLSQKLYPTFGRYLKGGFISHIAGKLFVRCGFQNVQLRIHNVRQGGTQNPGLSTTRAMSVLHLHYKDWDDWLARYHFRHQMGSYRPDLPPARKDDGMNLHQVLGHLEECDGQVGLKQFFDEVCADTPAHRERLDRFDLLKLCDLQLETTRARWFPDS
ncbi:glycosyltransferase family 2 protein [Pseudaestuariivita rosea]|uniref:glycosyltransferase family 2 protein n=1 Tax=Pseudaestuariivita rosea TaxID=2763263 RepID=UPI001ABACEEE|nr:glycosyltransferase family 2 protein [Pseudaestuariivita rosea]